MTMTLDEKRKNQMRNWALVATWLLLVFAILVGAWYQKQQVDRFVRVQRQQVHKQQEQAKIQEEQRLNIINVLERVINNQERIAEYFPEVEPPPIQELKGHPDQ